MQFPEIALPIDRAIAKVKTIQPYLPQRWVYITTESGALLDGGGCESDWFVGQMSDDNFKCFVYSLIIAAKVAGADIEIRVGECNGAYPNIVGLEYSPR